MSRISQSEEKSTNSPMYIAVFFSFDKNCIINVYCVSFSFFQNERKPYIIVVIFYVLFKKKKKENVSKTIILKVVFPMQAYSVLYSALFPCFVLQRIIVMFSKIIMVNAFFSVINVLLHSAKYHIHQFWLNQTFRFLF